MSASEALISALKLGEDQFVIQGLNENPALLFHRDKEGATLLHLAARYHQKPLAEHFLLKGLDPNILNHHNRTPLHDSFEAGATEISKLLLKNGAKVDINYAAGTGDLDAMEELISKQPEAVFDRSTGISVLEWAAYGDNDASIYFLHDHGVDVNAQESKSQSTALMAAARCNNCRAARALLELGSDPNLTSDEGFTALHAAATLQFSHDTTAISAIMLAYDANVNARGREQLTPLGVLQKTRKANPDPNRNFDGLEDLLQIHGAVV